jgi:hypothetical protein
MKKELTVCDICGENEYTTRHQLATGESAVRDMEGHLYWYPRDAPVNICSACMRGILTIWHKGLTIEGRHALSSNSLRYRNEAG